MEGGKTDRAGDAGPIHTGSMEVSAPISPASGPPPELAPAPSAPVRHSAGRARPSARLLDPGWLFLLAGLAILAATVLIPAQDDLDEARWLRDRALAVEAHRQQRLDRYGEYLSSLDNADQSLIQSLAASQLNQIPDDRVPLPGATDTARSSASVFPALEPDPLRLSDRAKVGSMLERWTTDDRTRIWLIGAGALCVLIGLLPQAVRRG